LSGSNSFSSSSESPSTTNPPMDSLSFLRHEGIYRNAREVITLHIYIWVLLNSLPRAANSIRSFLLDWSPQDHIRMIRATRLTLFLTEVS
jgi:hypothetical protein